MCIIQYNSSESFYYLFLPLLSFILLSRTIRTSYTFKKSVNYIPGLHAQTQFLASSPDTPRSILSGRYIFCVLSVCTPGLLNPKPMRTTFKFLSNNSLKMDFNLHKV